MIKKLLGKLWNSKPLVWLRENVTGGLRVATVVSCLSLACLTVVGIV